MKFSKDKRKALLGTLLFHLCLLICFVFLGLTYRIPPPEEEGISINFGYQDFGSGTEQAEQIVEEIESVSEEVQENIPDIEDPSTQEVEETDVVQKQNEEVKKLEEEIIQEEPKEQLNSKALYTGKKENNSLSQGITQGQGDQGQEDGDISSNSYQGGGKGTNGIAYQLGGRVVAEIKKPIYDSQQQGKVVVTIRVNRSGKVISATPGAKGSTTTNAYLYAKAKEAALKTTFEANSQAPEIQIGSIIYNFKLN
jgi:protein TonB